VSNITNISANTEQSGKQVAIQFSGEVLLRDYFAAKAMQAEMAQGIHESEFLETACRAYKMADAMLAARSQA